MSHKIILGGKDETSLLAVTDSFVEGALTWTPSHSLTPVQERRRIEWANEQIDKIKARLNAPAVNSDGE